MWIVRENSIYLRQVCLRSFTKLHLTNEVLQNYKISTKLNEISKLLVLVNNDSKFVNFWKIIRSLGNSKYFWVDRFFPSIGKVILRFLVRHRDALQLLLAFKTMANNINTFKIRLDLDLKGYYSSKELRVLSYIKRCSLQLLLQLLLLLLK